jgi:hypothetical protein
MQAPITAEKCVFVSINRLYQELTCTSRKECGLKMAGRTCKQEKHIDTQSGAFIEGTV